MNTTDTLYIHLSTLDLEGAWASVIYNTPPLQEPILIPLGAVLFPTKDACLNQSVHHHQPNWANLSKIKF